MPAREDLTTTEFARLTGVSRATLVRLIDRGRIPAWRIGSHRRIFRSDLEAAGLGTGGGPAAVGPAVPRRRDILRLAPRLTELAARRGARHVRLFGSVARDAADEASDVDVLVDLDSDRSLLDLTQLELDLEALLERRVEVGTAASVRPGVRGRVLAEAISL
ncbi:MAG: excisionase family DNA-binding protein [Candidatus Dormibacteraceae bacterium]